MRVTQSQDRLNALAFMNIEKDLMKSKENNEIFINEILDDFSKNHKNLI